MNSFGRLGIVFLFVTACSSADGLFGTQDGGQGASGAGGGNSKGGAGGGTGQCPAGKIWCPGCTAGSGMCSTGGCPGYACPPVGGVDAGTTDAGRCSAGQIWCPGCTAGSGMCSTGGCPGYACPPVGGTDGGATCAQATTLADCNAITGCHAVYYDPNTCGCALSGCCAHFQRCADGATTDCKGASLACTIATPFCESPYVKSYAGSCYEGCVLQTECAP